MKTLGITTSHDSAVALIEDGKIIYASSEERFNRRKLCSGPPLLALKDLFNYTKIGPSGIDNITYPFEYKADWKFFRLLLKNRLDLVKRKGVIKSLRLYGDRSSIFGMSERFRTYLLMYNWLTRTLEEHGLEKKPLKLINHHFSHIASAYYTSNFKQALIVSIDGYGDELSGMIAMGRGSKIDIIDTISFYDSMGVFYTAITQALGFKAVRHEGKITGLAAYGEPELYDLFLEKVIRFNNGRPENVSGYSRYKALPNYIKKLVVGVKRENVAASAQKILEDVVVNTVKNYINKLNLSDISVCLAGGTFANVKLNQRIREIAEVNNVFIHPHMGDGGLAVGSALAVNYPKEPYKLKDVYLGPSFSDSDIKNIIKKYNLKYKEYDAREVAELINNNKVIGWFDARMEYGPRALGHRSILYHPRDRGVNDWLNKRLKRTEFMPFAPVTLREKAKKCYKGYQDNHQAADFMTITYGCTEEMKKTQPAVVHVDGTARPQIIDKEIDSKYYGIVKAYHDITGIPTLINTSFNAHEEPIVCSPEDAVRSFVIQDTCDFLVIGDYLVKK